MTHAWPLFVGVDTEGLYLHTEMRHSLPATIAHGDRIWGHIGPCLVGIDGTPTVRALYRALDPRLN